MADQILKLPTKIDATSVRFEKNMRAMAELVAAVFDRPAQVLGAEQAVELSLGETPEPVGRAGRVRLCLRRRADGQKVQSDGGAAAQDHPTTDPRCWG